MIGGQPPGIGHVISPGLVLEHNVGFVVFEASVRADSETELRAEMHGRVDGLEGAHDKHNAAFLKGDVEAKVLRQGRLKV